MLKLLKKAWRDDDGALAFEWVLVTTLLAIAVVGGLAAARDAIIDELGDTAEAMLALDNSYTIAYPLLLAIDPAGINPQPVGLSSDSSFVDVQLYRDCAEPPRGHNGRRSSKDDFDA